MLAACGVANPTNVEVGEESSSLVTGNGHMQNGHMQNGHMQNGQTENGVELALVGVNLSTMQRLVTVPPAGQDPDLHAGNLVAMPNVRLSKGTVTDGIKAHADFSGHLVYGALSDGQQNVPVFIESMTAGDDPEVPHYAVKVYHQFSPAPGQSCNGPCPMSWDYACGTTLRVITYCPPPRNGGEVAKVACGTRVVRVPIPAVAVGGQWDFHEGTPGDGRKLIEQNSASYNTHVTFACTNGAIGKCVEKAHYKPWAPAATECRVVTTDGRLQCWTPTQELLHEACVRMVRADYCGDGKSMTVDGIGIDLWDQSHINTESEQVWGKEAEWTPNGARCLDVANMGRTAHIPGGMLLGEYLYWTCGHKWDGQPNQTTMFRWEDNDCFGHGPVSQHSTYYTQNLPADPTFQKLSSMDLHDRVWIMNRSMCVYVDGAPDMGNPDANNPLCF
jgi:hypothetical protein